jgi:hypothetical protein
MGLPQLRRLHVPRVSNAQTAQQCMEASACATHTLRRRSPHECCGQTSPTANSVTLHGPPQLGDVRIKGCGRHRCGPHRGRSFELEVGQRAGPGVNVNPVFREVWSGGVRGSAPIAAQGKWVCWAPAEPIRAQPHPPWRTTHPVADPSDPPPAVP